MKIFVLGFLFLAANSYAAVQPETYYGHAFVDGFAQGRLKGPALREKLHEILDSVHVTGADGFDDIRPSCTGGKCYQHQMVGYGAARKIIFGELFLTKQNGAYAVPDLYCERLLGADDLGGKAPGPGITPDHRFLNVEHTWP
ncbi:MAG: hypothetical protein EOP11_26255, partial [Proteobacteria bacterium]